MTYRVEVIVRVINAAGDVMNDRGQPSYLNKDGRLEKSFISAAIHESVDAAERDMNGLSDTLKDHVE